MIEFEVKDIRNMNLELKRFLDYLKGFEVDDDTLFDSRLVSCELITNALRHAGGGACFAGELVGGEIKITVRSSARDGQITIPSLPEVLSEGGRGLYIVNSLSGGNVKIEGGNVTVILKPII